MLQEIIIFLAAAGLIVPLMHRLKLSPVLGFLLVGMLIGPYGLGRLTEAVPVLEHVVMTDIEAVKHVAEFGVVFLLFLIGLELSLARLMRMRRMVFGLGALQVVFTGCLIGAVATAFGNPPGAALILGACLALSSTAIVMQLLIEKRRLGTPTGQTAFAILLFQDLSVVPILFAAQVMTTVAGVSAASAPGTIEIFLEFALAIGKAALAVVLILLIGRWVVRPLFRLVGASDSREMFMAAVLLVIIAISVATSQAGLSLALGAFLAGVLLSDSEYRHQVQVDIEPFKGLLLGLFFMSVGMELDVAAVLERPVLLAGAVVGLWLIKSAVIYVAARAFGIARSAAIETALLLGQAGEFAFVVIAVAVNGGLIPSDTAKFMLMVAGISMVLTPAMAGLARAAARRGAGQADATDGTVPLPDTSETVGHVIIAGYGRVGALIGRLLEDAHIAHVGLDRDARLVAEYAQAGTGVRYGDASVPRILELAGIANARALIVTMDNVGAAERIVRSVRTVHPDLPILVRARDADHARRLIEAGASDVVPETIEASFDLAEVAFGTLGISADTAHRLVADHRQRERAQLRGGKGSTGPSLTERDAPGERVRAD